MDEEKIKRVVDGYIGELMAELARYVQNTVSAGKGAQEEIKDIGLPEDLLMDLWDPQELFQESREVCLLHTKRMFQFLEGLDPEDEEAARRLIRKSLRHIVDELSPSSGDEHDFSPEV